MISDSRVHLENLYDGGMFDQPLNLTRPGLLVTGTDTGVGKTLVTCAIAHWLRMGQGDHGRRVGVCKPFATGCRREREGLVSDDAEALAHFADCRLPLDVINPIRFVQPVAPAVAAEQSRLSIDFSLVSESLRRIEAQSDVMLIEGVGGLLVPVDPDDPTRTVLDLGKAVGYPVVIVTRAGLGTLNHTAMTVQLLRDAGCEIAGLVINFYDADVAKQDPSMATNRQWMHKMTGVKVLATLPRCPDHDVQPQLARISPAVLDAMNVTYWAGLLGSSTISR